MSGHADLRALHQDLRCLREEVVSRLCFTHAELNDEWVKLQAEIDETVRVEFDHSESLDALRHRLTDFRARLA